MLEIRKTVVSFEERDLIDLERVITDVDEKGAFLISQEVHLRPYFALSGGETQISSGFYESCRRV
ncbi:hypothetical protein ACFLYX_03360 [Chloroflexota bacterium]